MTTTKCAIRNQYNCGRCFEVAHGTQCCWWKINACVLGIGKRNFKCFLPFYSLRLLMVHNLSVRQKCRFNLSSFCLKILLNALENLKISFPCVDLFPFCTLNGKDIWVNKLIFLALLRPQKSFFFVSLTLFLSLFVDKSSSSIHIVLQGNGDSFKFNSSEKHPQHWHWRLFLSLFFGWQICFSHFCCLFPIRTFFNALVLRRWFHWIEKWREKRKQFWNFCHQIIYFDFVTLSPRNSRFHARETHWEGSVLVNWL